MQPIIPAYHDIKGSETLNYDHFVVGSVGDDISGGLYIKKGAVLPEELVIRFRRKSNGDDKVIGNE